MVLKSREFSLSWKILVILATLCFRDVTSIWEYAVCTQKNIIFYDKEWNEVAETASGKFGNLKALTYDTTHDEFYFTDSVANSHTNINSLKLKSDGSIKIKTLIQLKDPSISLWDLVYDFNDDALFYSDRDNKQIMRINFDRKDDGNVTGSQVLFLETPGEPFGLELDACKRNLYYTVSSGDSNINVASIKDKNPKPVCNKKHLQPTAIALDERNGRIYVTDKEYKMYYINSFTTEGDDYRVDLKANGRTPRGLAVDHEYVYYLDGNKHELRRVPKHSESNGTSQFFMEFVSDPMDLIVRNNFIDAVTVDLSKCDVTEERMKELQAVIQKLKENEKQCTPVVTPKTCLHGGSYDERLSSCICKDSRYDGAACEIDLCYNFCLNGGECSMEKNHLTSSLVPTCSCTKGFRGARCEQDICSNHCLNSGKCSVNYRHEPVCECSGNFVGKRCETENAETQSVEIVTQKIDRTTTESIMSTTTSSTTTTTEDDLHIKTLDEKPALKCPVHMNITYIILGICLTLSLLFFLCILLVIKRFHKPMRPRIRKKFVVHKNIEPMTYRPTTEQCEVIIEDCCNMNICDTPCFDPKVLQQEINENNIKVKLTTSKRCNGSNKDDKQDLLKNMELNQ